MTGRVVRTAALLLAMTFGVGPARAQDGGIAAPAQVDISPADSALEAKTTAVAATLRCPVCQGESIQDSPSELARDMRALVRDQLREGKTPDEVKAFFVARYGEWILLEPKASGLNILLYLFPVAIVLGGLALVAVLVRKWSTPKAP